MNKKTRLKLLVSLGLCLGLAVLIILSIQTRTYQILEYKALDLRFALQGNQPARGPVVHIDIDDTSLARVGRWPWPRSFHAKLITILKECGAKQILWDVIFTEPFKDDPQQDLILADAVNRSGIVYFPFYFAEGAHVLTPELKALLIKDLSVRPQDVAQALKMDPKTVKDRLGRAKNELLDEVAHELMIQDPGMSFEDLLDGLEKKYGWFLFPEAETYLQERFAHEQVLAFFVRRFSVDVPAASWPFRKEIFELNVPIMDFSKVIKGSGFINADPDIDGVTRKVPLFVRYGDAILPQLTMAALIDRMEVEGLEVKPGYVILKQARFHPGRKDIRIPVDRQGRMIINWHGTWESSFKHIPYYLILQLQEIREQISSASYAQGQSSGGEKQIEPAGLEFLKRSEKDLLKRLTAIVKDKICIVGLTATGTHDLRPIPLQENYPMVGTHSNLMNTILTERFIARQPPLVAWAVILLTALVIAFSSLLKLWKSLLIGLGFTAGYFLLSLLLFIRSGLWLDLIGPTGTMVFGFLAVTSFRFFTEEKEKLWIKQAFSHYLSHEVINELMDDPSRLKLGGERRKITVMFSDVRGFTTFSESHEPEQVVAMLNEILSHQVKVIFKYNGTLDKFVGDEVMSFFGAPGNRHLNDHALVAVRTAFEIQQTLAQLRSKWDQEKKESLHIGIGINTGDMVVGNMGSAERMDYTVIGDNVNLGARLCSAASKNEIIIAESTYELVKDQIVAEKLEPISVKGKSMPISIYRVTGLK